jgi:chitinase
MKMKFTSFAAVVCLIASSFNASAQRQFKVVGYVPNWKSPASLANSLPYSKITHINYAFVQPDASGNIINTEGLSAIVQVAHQNGVKVIASLGGATASENNKALFWDLFSAAKADGFAKKVVDFVTQYELDGFDLDIEGPAINNTYEIIVKKLAPLLKAKGKVLTCALSQGYGGTNTTNAALQLMDWINVMAYDLTGSWEPNSPGPHSPYDWSIQQLSYWKGRVNGDASKVVLGVPFYGQGFGAEAGSPDYATILAKYPSAYGVDQIGSTIYYNGIPTIRSKTQYALRNAAGIMIWELTQDAVGQYSLLSTIDGEVKKSGIDPINRLAASLELFPNPVASDFSLGGLPSYQKIAVTVYDIMGKQVATFSQYKNSYTINQLPAGVYVVSVLLDGAEYAKLKVIKE